MARARHLLLRLVPALPALPAVSVLALHRALITPPFLDDNYIFYRYAADWAHGLGPVFNRGEWVEGFTSFLWTGLLAFAAALGAPPERAGPAFGLGLAIACLLLVAVLAHRHISDRPWVAGVLALALAFSPPFVAYAGSGMDTVLFAFVLLGAVGAVASWVDATRAGELSPAVTAVTLAVLVVLVLARAEGAIYALALALAALALSGGRRRALSMRRLALPAGTLLAVVAVLGARLLSYGSWMPASVLAKGYVSHLIAGLLRGTEPIHPLWTAVWSGAQYVGWLAFVLLALSCAALGVSRRRDRRLEPLAALGALAIAVGLASALWDTGDWMPYRRLLVPLEPLLVLLAGWAAVTFGAAAPRPRAAGPAAALLAAGGAALALLAVGVAPTRTPSRYEGQQLAALGHLLRASPEPVRLETNVAGILPYYAGARTYVWDMLGLTDIHNARHGQIFSPQFGRTDPGYDFSRPLDVLVTNSSWDFALLLAEAARLPGGADRYALLPARRWARLPLYVVVRAAGPARAPLERFCGCRALRLSVAVRARLLAGLVSRDAFPPALLAAARAHRPFPA